MKKDETKTSNIELRSEEVQELMGYTPPYIQRIGIGIILLLFIGLFIGSAFIKYPTYTPVKVRILTNENFETIMCPQNGTILAIQEDLVTAVHSGDTLCVLLSDEKDSIYIRCKSSGKANCMDVFVPGMNVAANTHLYLIEKDNRNKHIETELCLYLSDENKNRLATNKAIALKIEGMVYDFHITAVTVIPNSQGEHAVKGYINTKLPWNIMNNPNRQVEMLINEKTIFDIFFNKQLLKT